ncbi:MAG: hypothetical protein HQ582_34805 [Planctomycetes bacterium]|nr:hypothetical protein [Planctomycetota bacterium]
MRDSPAKRDLAKAHELFICWGLILLLSSSACGAKPSEGPSFPRIANVYGTAFTKDGTRFHGHHRTLEEAARYDLLVGVQRRQRNDPEGKMFRKHLEELKKINPHLIALHFACSAPYTHIAPPEEALAARQPGQIAPWLLQTDGQPIAGWPGTYMLNMAAPGVVDWLAHQAVPAVQQIGYDGVFIDCLGPHFDSWACEIATGKPYTVDFNADGKDDDREELKEVWTKAKTALARRTRELIGAEAVFMANQAGPATYDQLNGIYLEDYIDAILDRGMSWENVLEKYLHWTKTPRQPNVTVLGCGSAVEPPFEPFKLSPEERMPYLDRGKGRLQRMRFGLATTLMGDGYYSFDLHTRWRGQYWWYPEFDAPLGHPKGPCGRNADGTCRRQFDGGLVVVNPTGWDASLELGQMHRDVSSGQIDRRFVVPRLDGRIYLPSDGPIQPSSLSPVEPRLTMTGPAGVVERDGNRVFRDGHGMAILIGPKGTIESLCSGEQELIDSIAPVIVTDDKWRNFDTENLQHQVGSDGSVTLTGQRTHGQQILEFTQTIRLIGGRLRLQYDWLARTPLQLRAFRQSVRFSPRVFGGRVMSTATDRVHLPQDPADDPNLAKGITSATLPIHDGQSITIDLPLAAHLIDDRYYNGSGYLLAFYPIAGEVAEGRQWSYTIEIAVGRATPSTND